MFEKLRRAKSFISRTKHEEEVLKQTSLDLSETAHLRRNVPINNEVLERQKRLNRSQEKLNNHRSRKLQRQVSRSHEHLHDQVLEQLRKLNFGDSYSKKDAKILSETRKTSQEFQRLHPAYFSERNFRRKSVGGEDSAQKTGIAHNRASGDVVSSFGTKKAMQRPPIGSDDDFLLNRKSVDMNYNFNRRNPAYVSERSALSKRSGFRSFLQKIKGTQRSNESVVASDTGYSTASSGASFVYEDAHHYTNTGSCSNSSTASSSASVGFDRSHHSERLISYNSKRDIVVNNNNNGKPTGQTPLSLNIEGKLDEERSRKRQHYQTKPSRAPERSSSGEHEERRHKVFNRKKREDCLVDNR